LKNIIITKRTMASLKFVQAHEAGYCDVAYVVRADSTVTLVTCGKEGKLCYRSLEEPENIIQSVETFNKASGEPVAALTSIVASPMSDRLCIADDRNFVKVFTFPEGNLHAVATRFTLPARCLAYSPSGLNLAASGDDEGIKLVDLAGGKVFRTLPSDEYTRGLAYDPEGDFIAAISAQGTLTIWNIGTGKNILTKRKYCTKADVGVDASRVTPAWHPDGGSLLAIPTPEGTIILLERLSWETVGELSHDDDAPSTTHNAPIQILSFSKNGLYLASVASDGSLILWDVVDRSIISKKFLPGAACAVAWHPSANQLTVITEDGQLAVWDDPLPSDRTPPHVEIDVGSKGVDALIDDRALDDEDDDDGDGSDSGTELDGESDGDDFIDDPVSERKRVALSTGGVARRRRKGKYSALRGDGGGYSPPTPQAPFQPGSTSMDAGRRYLAFNALGSIVLRRESDHNIVEVSFHDTLSSRVPRRVPLLSDFYGFTVGALGEGGALYAAPATSETTATVVFRPFEPWALPAEWSLSLPPGEQVVACGVGGTGFVALVTSARLLRLLSQGGRQAGPLSLPGPPLTCATTHGKCAVFWHRAAPLGDGEQCLGVDVYEVGPEAGAGAGQRLVHRGAVPVGGTLSWVGYTDEGVLAAFDSVGCLRILDTSRGTWTPMFDAVAERKGSEHFWLFAVSLRRGEVSCIVCADSPEPRVPSGAARLVVTAAPVRLFLAESHEGGDVLSLETEMVRAEMLMTSNSEGRLMDEDENDIEKRMESARLEHDKTALKLILKLVSTERVVKAFDVVLCLQTQSALEGAMKIAAHHRATALADRITELITARSVVHCDDVIGNTGVNVGHEELENEPPPHHTWTAIATAPREQVTTEQVTTEQVSMEQPFARPTPGLMGKRKVVGNPFARRKRSGTDTKQ
jgi:chromosome transmission fidelity protein 4